MELGREANGYTTPTARQICLLKNASGLGKEKRLGAWHRLLVALARRHIEN